MPTLRELLVRLGVLEPEDPGTYSGTGAAVGGAAGGSLAALPVISALQDLERSRRFERMVRGAKNYSADQLAEIVRPGDIGLSGKAIELQENPDSTRKLIREALRGNAPERLLRRGSMAASGSPLYHGFALMSGGRDPELYPVHSGNFGGNLGSDPGVPLSVHKARAFVQAYRDTSGTQSERIRAGRQAAEAVASRRAEDVERVARLSPSAQARRMRRFHQQYNAIEPDTPSAVFRLRGAPELDRDALRKLEQRLARTGGISTYAVPEAGAAAARSVMMPRQLRRFLRGPGQDKRFGQLRCVGGHCGVAPNTVLDALTGPSKADPLSRLPTDLLDRKDLELVGVTRKPDILRGFRYARRGRGLAGVIGALGLGGAGALAGAAAGGLGGGLFKREKDPTIWDNAENWLARRFG